jgi:hypothetical protein
MDSPRKLKPFRFRDDLLISYRCTECEREFEPSVPVRDSKPVPQDVVAGFDRHDCNPLPVAVTR